MDNDATHFALTLTLEQGYAFAVDFGQEHVPALMVDEPPPLGAGRGPNAARLLGAAIGNCLGASLVFCLRRSRIEVAGLRTEVDGTLAEECRWRLGTSPPTVPAPGPRNHRECAQRRCRRAR